MIRTTVAILAATGLMVSPAFAADMTATVAGVPGSILVNHGGSFQSPMGSATVLRQGDRIVAKSGVAKIAFSDGCKVDLKAGSMITIGKASPCSVKGGLTKVQGEEVVTLPLFGTVGVTTAVVGGVVAVGAVVGITAAAGGFDDSSTSP